MRRVSSFKITGFPQRLHFRVVRQADGLDAPRVFGLERLNPSERAVALAKAQEQAGNWFAARLQTTRQGGPIHG